MDGPRGLRGGPRGGHPGPRGRGGFDGGRRRGGMMMGMRGRPGPGPGGMRGGPGPMGPGGPGPMGPGGMGNHMGPGGPGGPMGPPGPMGMGMGGPMGPGGHMGPGPMGPGGHMGPGPHGGGPPGPPMRGRGGFNGPRGPFNSGHDNNRGGNYNRGGFRGGNFGARRGFPMAPPQGPGPHPVPTIETRGPPQMPNRDHQNNFGGRNPGNFKGDRGHNKGNFVPRNNDKGGRNVPIKASGPPGNAQSPNSAQNNKSKPADKPPISSSEEPVSSGIPTIERSAVSVIGGGMKRPDRGGHHMGGKRPRRDFIPKGSHNQHHQNYQQQSHQQQLPPQQNLQQVQSNGYSRGNHNHYQNYDNSPHVESYPPPHGQYNQSNYSSDNGYMGNNLQYGISQGSSGYAPAPVYSHAPVSQSTHQGYEMSDYSGQYSSNDSAPVYAEQYSLPSTGYEQAAVPQYAPVQYSAPVSYQQPPPMQQSAYTAYDTQAYVAAVDYAPKPEYGAAPAYY